MPTDDTLAALLLDTTHRMMRVMAGEIRQVRPDATDTHMAVLTILGQGRMTSSALAQTMAVTSATMTNTLATMEARQWVQRVRDHDDRRVVWVVVTLEGALVRQQIQQHMAGKLAALLGHLTQAQTDTLDQALRLLREAVLMPPP